MRCRTNKIGADFDKFIVPILEPILTPISFDFRFRDLKILHNLNDINVFLYSVTHFSYISYRFACNILAYKRFYSIIILAPFKFIEIYLYKVFIRLSSVFSTMFEIKKNFKN